MPRRLELVKSLEVSPSLTKEKRCEEIQKFFGAAIDKGEEGLVRACLEHCYAQAMRTGGQSHAPQSLPTLLFPPTFVDPSHERLFELAFIPTPVVCRLAIARLSVRW